MTDKEAVFLNTIEFLNNVRESDEVALEQIIRQADTALKSKDIERLNMIASETVKEDTKSFTIRHAELLRFNELIHITAVEKDGGMKLFIADTDSFSDLMEKYNRINMYLRRIELDIAPGVEEAYAFIRTQEISPFAVAGILYQMTSRIGHRENVLMKLAEDALESGEFLRAYSFLTTIRDPSDEAKSLKNELGQAIKSFRNVDN